MIISGKLCNNPLFASVIFTYITSSSHLHPIPLPLRHLYGPSVQPFWATSVASSQSSLPGCWPTVVASGSTPPSRPLSNPSDKPPRPLASHPCLCPVVAFGSTPSSQPLANYYVSPPRPLQPVILALMLATLSCSCLCATSAASVKLSLPGCWQPCPGVASAPPPRSQSNPLYLEAGQLVLELPLRHLRSLCQTLFTWMLATLSWSCLCATSAASVKPSLPGGWPPCPGAASASLPRPLSIVPGISC